MTRFFVLIAFVLFAGCTVPDGELTERRQPSSDRLPPMKTFAARGHRGPTRSNPALARDFLELSFSLESGRPLPVFTRFEGPITVRLTGEGIDPQVERDLEALLLRLRKEARISIRRVPASQQASITIETVSRKTLQRAVPAAACFVVPNAKSWADFRKLRRSNVLDWSRITTRTHAAIFLPGDVAPQEMRDCLHEELAQALGPLNDLYRLSDSVFNDDNFHTILTGFDMLMLRATYSPRLRSGMTKAEVANNLPRIFSVINPNGSGFGIAAPIETPRQWISAVETALGPRASSTRRLGAAQEALAIAQENGWSDNRMAFSLFIHARLSLGHHAEAALTSFFQAATLYGSSEETALHAAHVGMQLAAYSVSSGDGETAVDIVNQHLPAVSQGENAALLSTLLLLKAEALSMIGKNTDAAIVREDGLAWARYGFGTDKAVNARLTEIESLRPIS